MVTLHAIIICMASPQKENGYTPIANELYEAIIKTPIPGRHKDLWHFVLRKTYGFGKKVDTISLSQFVVGTGIDRSSVCRIIKDLVAWNLLVKNGNKYSIYKDYAKWVVAQRPLGSGVEVNKVVAYTPHTKETIQKKDTVASSKRPQKTMKKNKMGSYREDSPSDSHEEVIDADTGAPRAPKQKQKQSVLPAYKELVDWAVQRRGKPFMPGTGTKMYKAFNHARTFGLTPGQLKARWVEMEGDKFWQEKGFDWMTVVYSFNKKPR